MNGDQGSSSELTVNGESELLEDTADYFLTVKDSVLPFIVMVAVI